MSKGWIKLHRKSFENDLYFAEPFTKWQAWTDLLLLANHKDGSIRKRGIRVIVERGQVGCSEVTLAKRWKWSRGKVRRFLNDLKMVQQIVQQKTHTTSLISIVNYDEYQVLVQQTEQQTDIKRYTNNNENLNNSIVKQSENEKKFEFGNNYRRRGEELFANRIIQGIAEANKQREENSGSKK